MDFSDSFLIKCFVFRNRQKIRALKTLGQTIIYVYSLKAVDHHPNKHNQKSYNYGYSYYVR